jgi:autoinducer 2 (AI-2) kinase
VMTIDAGTGSCRAVIFDAAGRQIAMAQREWRHPALDGIPGSQSFETAHNWELICQCTREALGLSGLPAEAIAAVSATSMREGIVCYDQAGEVLFACPNADARSASQATELVSSGAAQTIYEIAGDWVAITSPARLRWLAQTNPDAFAAVRHVGMLSDWILYRFSGRYVTDPTCGSSSGMFDLASRTWSEEIIDICGLPRTCFPDVLEPGTPLGALTETAAAETGLARTTAVVVGGADTQMALLGLGLQTGASTVIGGTFWQTTSLVDRPLIDPGTRLRTLCHAIPGQWMVEGIGFYSGMAMRWFRDAFCVAEVAAATQRGEDPYAGLERMAQDLAPGSGGVVALMSNVMDSGRWVHCAPTFMGFDVNDPVNSGKGACVRAIEEAAAYVVRAHLAIVDELTGARPPELTFAGGAAAGTLWPAILADVTGRSVRIPENCESSSLGTAYCALAGAGLVDDPISAARSNTRWARRHDPAAAAVTAYEGLYEQWREIYSAALDLCDRGLARPLWQAPGT